MLRVGLTGGLGSGKSTAARMFEERGAVVFLSDAIGRELMQPGQEVYRAIAERFGAGIVLPGGQLDRPALARLVFQQGDVEALNAIVHPAVIAQQEHLISELAEHAIVIVESALIFETRFGGAEGWRRRFDQMILVMAPETLKIARFLDRSGATAANRAAFEAEAHRRLALQIPDAVKMPQCDFVVRNDGTLVDLASQVASVWTALLALERKKAIS